MKNTTGAPGRLRRTECGTPRPWREDDALQMLRSLASLAATVQTAIRDDELRQLAHRDIVEMLASLNETVVEPPVAPAAVLA